MVKSLPDWSQKSPSTSSVPTWKCRSPAWEFSYRSPSRLGVPFYHSWSKMCNSDQILYKRKHKLIIHLDFKSNINIVQHSMNTGIAPLLNMTKKPHLAKLYGLCRDTLVPHPIFSECYSLFAQTKHDEILKFLGTLQRYCKILEL